MSKVLVVSDGKRERELLLVERLVVGRDPMCDLSHDDALLSRRHAEFATEGEAVLVRDLGSRNGLFVNGTRAAERSLRPGDIVQIGPLRVRYMVSEGAASLTPDDLDSGATKVLASRPPAPAPAPPAPPPAPPALTPRPMPMPVRTTPLASIRVNTPADHAGDGEDFAHEDVTRVGSLSEELEASLAAAQAGDEAEATMMVTAEEIGSGVHAAAAPPSPELRRTDREGTDAGAPATLRLQTPPPGRPTVVIPPPSPAAYQRPPAVPAAPVASVARATPLAPDVAPVPLPDATVPTVISTGLDGFVFIVLAALASVVFVASAAPLIMWQGTGTLVGEPTAGNLLRWPVLPIIIALATTYVVATLVNRRFTETLIATRNDLLAGSEQAPPGDYRL